MVAEQPFSPPRLVPGRKRGWCVAIAGVGSTSASAMRGPNVVRPSSGDGNYGQSAAATTRSHPEPGSPVTAPLTKAGRLDMFMAHTSPPGSEGGGQQGGRRSRPMKLKPVARPRVKVPQKVLKLPVSKVLELPVPVARPKASSLRRHSYDAARGTQQIQHLGRAAILGRSPQSWGHPGSRAGIRAARAGYRVECPWKNSRPAGNVSASRIQAIS